jgi:hypothetical protein
MLIATVSLLMNVALYAILLIAIIVACDYGVIAVAWLKYYINNAIVELRKKLFELQNVFKNIQTNVSGAVAKLSNLNLNPLAGIC